ncbi:hypothetical protein HID58_071311 [Brassica napus]|uniref:Uncharacterized protein n=1 Tax=Brassica napus TaxID=3708 RepID=A0ABQ7Z192_BRANA|nr:hypothetical protein HID58_071311 [Brassica napus]
MFQSTIDGGIGSSARARCKKKSVPMKSVICGGRRKPMTQGKKFKAASSQSQKKKKIQEEIPDFDDELDEDELDDENDSQNRENRQISDVWDDFKVANKPNGEMKDVCNHYKNEYASYSHSHGTSGELVQELTGQDAVDLQLEPVFPPSALSDHSPSLPPPENLDLRVLQQEPFDDQVTDYYEPLDGEDMFLPHMSAGFSGLFSNGFYNVNDFRRIDSV